MFLINVLTELGFLGESSTTRAPRVLNSDVCKKSVLIGGTSVGSLGSRNVVNLLLWSMKNIWNPTKTMTHQWKKPLFLKFRGLPKFETDLQSCSHKSKSRK